MVPVPEYNTWLCDPTGMSENSANKTEVSVYPNPALTRIIVNLPQTNVYTIRLSNVPGAVCSEFFLAEENTEIDLSQFNTGIYFLQVFEKGNLVAAKKIIKE